MTDGPWLGDACSLVDAYRAGERSPAEEAAAVLDAIAASDLNAFSFVDADGTRARAEAADVSLPFGGVPVGVKELDHVAGWPATEASLVFRDRVASWSSTMVSRLQSAGGANLVGLTTASEFGGLNVSTTRLNGTTHNPWQHGRTAGGSSGGSAAAVAGGVVPIATGGDGGGSIRIPAGFNGLVGMKGTVGRIPRGPQMLVGPQTVVIGCLARSVRDVARWYDVCAGFDARDPYSLPRIPGPGWEASLGSSSLRGLRVAVSPDLGGGAVVRPEVAELVASAAAALAEDAGFVVVDEADAAISLPGLGVDWAVANLATLLVDLGDEWPACKDLLTAELAFGMEFAEQLMSLKTAASVEDNRRRANEAMADLFERVDLVLCATNPDVAYPAEVTLNTRVGGVKVGPENNGALTIPANICGNPACSVPIGTVDGLPVGLQVIGRHHEDAVVLDAARVVEQARPWPLTAPAAPC